MRPKTSVALSALLVTLLLASLLLQAWALPAWVARVVAQFPEVEHVATPAVVWGVVATACGQAVLLAGLRLVALARRGVPAVEAARWWRVVLGGLLAYVLLAAAAFLRLQALGYATPGLMLALLVTGATAAVGAGVVHLRLGTRPPVARPVA